MNDPSPNKVWQEKLDFLLVEEAKASDPVAKFSLAKAIDEAKRKLKELEPEDEPGFAADNCPRKVRGPRKPKTSSLSEPSSSNPTMTPAPPVGLPTVAETLDAVSAKSYFRFGAATLVAVALFALFVRDVQPFQGAVAALLAGIAAAFLMKGLLKEEGFDRGNLRAGGPGLVFFLVFVSVLLSSVPQLIEPFSQFSFGRKGTKR